MARIAIPQAGLRGGASTRAVPQEASGAGAAIAALGERVADAAWEVDRTRRETELAQARVSIARELGEARLTYEAETDPAAIDAGFRARADELREAAVSRVDPRNAEAVGLAFDELRDRHAFALGSRAIALGGERARGALAEQESAVLAEATPTDPDTADLLLDQYADSVWAAVEAGHVTPEQGADRIASMRRETANARALRLLDEAPDALVTQLDEGGFAELDPSARERLRLGAGRELQRREEIALRQAELDARERARAIGEDLSRIAALARAGRPVAGEAALEDPEYRDHPGYAEAAAAVALRDGLPEFATLPPAEMRARIEEERARPVGERFEANVLDAMETAWTEARKAWRDDPVAAADRLWGNAPPLPEDLTDPAGAAKAMQARRGYARALVDEGYAPAATFFTEDERARLKRDAGVEADPAMRAQLAATLAAGFGEDAPRAMAEIGADPVFRHVGAMIVNRARPDLAEDILRGQQQLGSGAAGEMPPQARRMVLGEELGDTFADAPAMYEQVAAAADALFATRARGMVVDAGLDEVRQLYAEAVQEVLGRRAVAGGGVFSGPVHAGGVQEVRDARTYLPPDLTGPDVERALDLAARDIRRDEGLGLFRDASRTGGRPAYADGSLLTEDDARRVALRPEADGVYSLFVLDAEGEPVELIDDASGELYLLDLADFVEAAFRTTGAEPVRRPGR